MYVTLLQSDTLYPYGRVTVGTSPGGGWAAEKPKGPERK